MDEAFTLRDINALLKYARAKKCTVSWSLPGPYDFASFLIVGGHTAFESWAACVFTSTITAGTLLDTALTETLNRTL